MTFNNPLQPLRPHVFPCKSCGNTGRIYAFKNWLHYFFYKLGKLIIGQPVKDDVRWINAGCPCTDSRANG